MTVHLDWPPEVVDRLTKEASQRGMSLDAYLLQTVLQQDPYGYLPTGDAAKRRAREEAGRSIRELRQGNTLGLDLTVRDLIDEGSGVDIDRVVPIVAHAVAVFGDEQKASHWLATPLGLLGNQSPVQIFAGGGDVEAVDQILTRIEHNIPS